MHGVLATSDHSIDRKREEKAVVLLPPFFTVYFPHFFYLLVKRLHFLAIVIGQDQGSAVRDLMSRSDSLRRGTHLQAFVCKTGSSTTACNGCHKGHRSQTAVTEEESVFGRGSGVKYFLKGICVISGRVNWN